MQNTHTFKKMLQKTNTYSDSSTTTSCEEKLKKYIIGKRITDDGAFGMIHVVKNMEDRQYYVMKIMSKKEIEKADMVENIETEIEIQSKMDHKNIVKIVDSFEDRKYLYVVLEYMMKGDLFDLLHEENPYGMFEDFEAKRYVRDIAQGLAHLHAQGIVHRDIKLENLLVNEYDVVKLADFGWAADVANPPKAKNSSQRHRKDEDEMTILAGTTEYMAPEMIKGEKYNQQIDIWALGVVMFELLTGDIPFNKKFKKNKKLFRRTITHGTIKYPSFLTPQAISLLKKMLTKDPKQRITAAEILEHPWLKQTEEEMIASQFDNKFLQNDDRRYSL